MGLQMNRKGVKNNMSQIQACVPPTVLHHNLTLPMALSRPKKGPSIFAVGFHMSDCGET